MAVARKRSALKAVVEPTGRVYEVDALDVDARLYRQVSMLLDQLEGKKVVDMRERIAALSAIARIRIAYTKLSAGKDKGNVGSAVRKYSAAFAANAASGRAGHSGPVAVALPDREDDLADELSLDDDPAA